MDKRPARGHTVYDLLSSLDDRRLSDGAWFAAVVIATAMVVYLLKQSSTPRPEPTVRSAPVTQAEGWIQANIARATPLSADPAVAVDLRVSGFTAAHAVEADGRGTQYWNADEFIVSTPRIREVVSRSLERAAARTSTEPVAVFGGAADRVEVRMIVHASASSLDERLARDARDRAAAGSALVHNPRVMLHGALRTLLGKGELDLRAATVLALLAARTDVHITEIVTDKSEAVAGRPARTLTVMLRDAKALATTLRTLPAAYAPARVGETGAATRLAWSVGLAPMSILA
jgi:hypothetical protein